jgi:MYXO-CTERM domain-containing protein
VFVGDGGVGDAGSGSHCDPVEPTVTESRCMPPFYEFYAHASASGADKGGALGSVQNESAGGAPRAPSDGSADAGPATGSEGTDSVCSVARVHGASGRPNSAWLATLSLLGLAFASRRRSRAAR